MRALATLPVRLTDPASYDEVFTLAERQGLSIYDAAHLDVAMQA